jgi:hypothetical protein
MHPEVVSDQLSGLEPESRSPGEDGEALQHNPQRPPPDRVDAMLPGPVVIGTAGDPIHRQTPCLLTSRVKRLHCGLQDPKPVPRAEDIKTTQVPAADVVGRHIPELHHLLLLINRRSVGHRYEYTTVRGQQTAQGPEDIVHTIHVLERLEHADDIEPAGRRGIANQVDERSLGGRNATGPQPRDGSPVVFQRAELVVPPDLAATKDLQKPAFPRPDLEQPGARVRVQGGEGPAKFPPVTGIMRITVGDVVEVTIPCHVWCGEAKPARPAAAHLDRVRSGPERAKDLNELSIALG